MTWYRKKPVAVEAMQFTAATTKQEVRAFVTADIDETNASLSVRTKNGWAKVYVNDWIIKGVEGEFYPCDPSIFEKTYEPIPDPT